jgi:hypothetical protein
MILQIVCHFFKTPDQIALEKQIKNMIENNQYTVSNYFSRWNWLGNQMYYGNILFKGKNDNCSVELIINDTLFSSEAENCDIYIKGKKRDGTHLITAQIRSLIYQAKRKDAIKQFQATVNQRKEEIQALASALLNK